jgi:hypothetical protein
MRRVVEALPQEWDREVPPSHRVLERVRFAEFEWQPHPWYHRRGELAVYLRLPGIAVPVAYGRSADENPLAATAAGAAR